MVSQLPPIQIGAVSQPCTGTVDRTTRSAGELGPSGRHYDEQPTS